MRVSWGAGQNQCRHILREKIGDENFQVVLLVGSGRKREQTDVALVREALHKSGWKAEEIR